MEVSSSISDDLSSVINELEQLKMAAEDNHLNGNSKLEVLLGRVKQINSDVVLLETEFDMVVEQKEILEGAQFKDQKFPQVYGPRFLNNWLPENFNSLRLENFSIVLIDIDFFSKVNATYGHDPTDEILKRFIEFGNEFLETETRRGESVFGRIGGDEFYILIYNAPFERAYSLAEKFRREVGMVKYFFNDLVPKPDTEIEAGERYTKNNLSISAGIYSEEIAPGKKSDEEVYRFLAKSRNLADRALYLGKKAGRDQIFTEESLKSCQMFFK